MAATVTRGSERASWAVAFGLVLAAIAGDVRRDSAASKAPGEVSMKGWALSSGVELIRGGPCIVEVPDGADAGLWWGTVRELEVRPGSLGVSALLTGGPFQVVGVNAVKVEGWEPRDPRAGEQSYRVYPDTPAMRFVFSELQRARAEGAEARAIGDARCAALLEALERRGSGRLDLTGHAVAFAPVAPATPAKAMPPRGARGRVMRMVGAFAEVLFPAQGVVRCVPGALEDLGQLDDGNNGTETLAAGDTPRPPRGSR